MSDEALLAFGIKHADTILDLNQVLGFIKIFPMDDLMKVLKQRTTRMQYHNSKFHDLMLMKYFYHNSTVAHFLKLESTENKTGQQSPLESYNNCKGMIKGTLKRTKRWKPRGKWCRLVERFRNNCKEILRRLDVKIAACLKRTDGEF